MTGPATSHLRQCLSTARDSAAWHFIRGRRRRGNASCLRMSKSFDARARQPASRARAALAMVPSPGSMENGSLPKSPTSQAVRSGTYSMIIPRRIRHRASRLDVARDSSCENFSGVAEGAGLYATAEARTLPHYLMRQGLVACSQGGVMNLGRAAAFFTSTALKLLSRRFRRVRGSTTRR